MPGLRGGGPQGPRRTPRAHDHAGRRGLETTRRAIAPAVGGLFFPQNQALGIDHSGFSPRVQQKIVHAGVNSVSYQQASRDLAELSDLKVEPKPVERMVRKIGQERIDQRDAAVAAHQRLPLMAKDAVANPKRSCPAGGDGVGRRGPPADPVGPVGAEARRVTGESPKSRSWKPIKAMSIKPIPTPTCRAVFST